MYVTSLHKEGGPSQITEAEWRRLVDAYALLIFRTAQRAGLADSDARQVVTRIMIQLVQQTSGSTVPPEKETLSTWLLWVTRTAIIRRYREVEPESDPIRTRPVGRGNRPAKVRFIDQSLLEWSVFWENSLRNDPQRLAFDQIKGHLPPIHRRIFDRHVFQGRPAKDVAQELRIEVRRVYAVKHRVNKRLQQVLSRWHPGSA